MQAKVYYYFQIKLFDIFNFQISKITLDSCPIEDLGLNFTLPGHPSIELRKNGQNIDVTIDNLENYIQVKF